MEEKVIDFLAQKLSLSRENITSDTVLADMGADSMALLSMVIEMEEFLGTEFSDREIGSFVTVGDIVRAAEKKEDKK